MPLQNIQQKVMTFCSARRRLTYVAAKWNVAAGRMLEKAAATRANAVACAGLAAPYINAKNASHPLAPTVMTKKRKVTNRARARSNTIPPSTRIAAAVKSVASASEPVADPGKSRSVTANESMRQCNPGGVTLVCLRSRQQPEPPPRYTIVHLPLRPRFRIW